MRRQSARLRRREDPTLTLETAGQSTLRPGSRWIVPAGQCRRRTGGWAAPWEPRHRGAAVPRCSAERPGGPGIGREPGRFPRGRAPRRPCWCDRPAARAMRHPGRRSGPGAPTLPDLRPYEDSAGVSGGEIRPGNARSYAKPLSGCRHTAPWAAGAFASRSRTRRGVASSHPPLLGTNREVSLPKGVGESSEEWGSGRRNL